VAARVDEIEGARGRLAEGSGAEHGVAKWFGHEPEKWPEFQKRYRAEMKAQPQAMAALRSLRKNIKK